MDEQRLRNYRALAREIDNQRKRIAEYDGEMSNIGGVDYTKDRVTGGGYTGDRLPAMLDKKQELLDMLNADVQRLELERIAIELAVMSLDSPTEREVIRLHYIDGLSWSKVGQRFHYSRDWATKTNGIALQHLAQKEYEK